MLFNSSACLRQACIPPKGNSHGGFWTLLIAGAAGKIHKFNLHVVQDSSGCCQVLFDVTKHQNQKSCCKLERESSRPCNAAFAKQALRAVQWPSTPCTVSAGRWYRSEPYSMLVWLLGCRAVNRVQKVCFSWLLPSRLAGEFEPSCVCGLCHMLKWCRTKVSSCRGWHCRAGLKAPVRS